MSRLLLTGMLLVAFPIDAWTRALQNDASVIASPSDAPVTMAQLKNMKTRGVAVAEVADYVYGNYAGG